jgi:hypothetical protein
MFRVIYAYIVRPKSILNSLDQYRLGPASTLVLCLIAAGSLSGADHGNVIMAFGAQVILIASLLMIQAFVTDFFAQLSGLAANSLKLFQLFTLSLLPFLAEPALNGLLGVPHIGIFVGLISAALFVYTLYLQLISVKALYRIETSKAILIYCVPALIILAAVFVVVIAAIYQVGFL